VGNAYRPTDKKLPWDNRLISPSVSQRFGGLAPSMSAHHILLEVKKLPRGWTVSSIKVVLGLERRDSSVPIRQHGGNLRGSVLSNREDRTDKSLVDLLANLHRQGRIAKFGTDKRQLHLSVADPQDEMAELDLVRTLQTNEADGLDVSAVMY